MGWGIYAIKGIKKQKAKDDKWESKHNNFPAVCERDAHHYYTTARPERSSIEEKLYLSGFVYPGKEIEIKPQISGVVEAIHVSVGDHIKKGDPIASVSLVPNSSEVEQLTSNLNLAKIKLESAKTKYERQKQLYEAKSSFQGYLKLEILNLYRYFWQT